MLKFFDAWCKSGFTNPRYAATVRGMDADRGTYYHIPSIFG